MGKRTLFDDDDGDQNRDNERIKVNEDYARRFEHNKKREELHRLKEKYPEVAARMEARAATAVTAARATNGNLGANRHLQQEHDDVEAQDSSSDDEDDDQGIIDSRTEAQIFETLLKIRRKDESIYNKEVKFFESDGESDGNGDGKGKGDANDDDISGGKHTEASKSGSLGSRKAKKDRPMYLKDMIFKEAVERAEGAVSDSSDDEYDANRGEVDRQRESQPQGGTYVEEQEQLKREFLQAFDAVQGAEADKHTNEQRGIGKPGDHDTASEEDEFGGVLRPRGDARHVADGRRGDTRESDASRGKTSVQGGENDRVQQLLDSYFGGDDGRITEEDKFLRQFILNKGWIDRDGADSHIGGGGYGTDEDTIQNREGEVNDEEDEAALEAAEMFEARYNFRFEEPGGASIVTHPRNIDGIVRKEDDRRKRQRMERAARKAAEEESRAAEIRRLKNLKKVEIEEKLAEVKAVAGADAPDDQVLDELLAGDFDPEAHDRAMAAAFNDDYYAAGDSESDEDLAMDEIFEKELEAMAKYGSDEDEGIDPADKLVLRQGDDNDVEEAAAGNNEYDIETDNNNTIDENARQQLQQLVEEYHKLDYEDHVGGIPTRFRYRQVEPETYGLDLEEILAMDDKELNQIVGLKRVTAAYREGGRVRPNFGKLNELRRNNRQAEGGSQHRRKHHVFRHERGRHASYQRGRDQPFGNRRQGHGSEGRFWVKEGQEEEEERSHAEGGYRDVERAAFKPPTEAEKRLATFQRPTLKKRKEGSGFGGRVEPGSMDKESNGKRKKHTRDRIGQGGQGGGKESQRQQQQQRQAGAPSPGLSKTQKKNSKRGAKRAARRAAAGAEATANGNAVTA